MASFHSVGRPQYLVLSGWRVPRFLLPSILLVTIRLNRRLRETGLALALRVAEKAPGCTPAEMTGINYVFPYAKSVVVASVVW